MSGKSTPTFWNPRVDPDSVKPASTLTFSRPRKDDFSSVAWDKRSDFWSQKEPMTEFYYYRTQSGGAEDKEKGK